MGSITEEQLIHMVRDFIESESEPQISVSSSEPITHHRHQPTYIDALQEIIWRATDSEVEILEKILKSMRNLGESFREPIKINLKKWVVLRLKMEGYEASLCKTSWVSFHGRAKGDYEFVDVMMRRGTHESCGNSDTKTTIRLIVDMDLRSQFELARPTSSYKKLLETLPSIFVGTEEKLGDVVSLLCSAAKQSLKENNLHIPPWRKASYMLTKWFSENCIRLSISPNMELGIMEKRDGNSCTTTTCTDLGEFSFERF